MYIKEQDNGILPIFKIIAVQIATQYPVSQWLICSIRAKKDKGPRDGDEATSLVKSIVYKMSERP